MTLFQKNQFILLVLLSITFPVHAQTLPASRDKFSWPFSQNSIWNTPIGSKAKYRPARLRSASSITTDLERIILTSAPDPVREVYAPKTFAMGRCEGEGRDEPYSLQFPDGYVVPDATDEDTPNNAVAIILPDGRSVVQFNVFARCNPTGPLYGYRYDDADLYGDGALGGHGGSGLSSIGGSLRKGEVSSTLPIRHALKINIWAKKYLSLARGKEGGKGFRWPAIKADSYANQKTYGGRIKGVMMGSLLAIPPRVSAESIGIETELGRKLFFTLQNYGAYIVDDTAFNSHAFAVEDGVEDEIKQAYGFDIETESPSDPWFRDGNRLR